MKKFIFITVMSLLTLSVSAQELEQSKFFDNTYVGVSTGVGAWLHPNKNGFNNFYDGIHSVSSIRVGKWFTPSVGGEFTYEFGANARPEFGHSSFTGANFMVNISNAIGGYKGEPRLVEVVPFIGGGWHHTHNLVTNNIAARAGSQVNFNMGKKKAWQINVIPSINYILTDNGFTNQLTGQPRFDSSRSWVALQVGVTYKFKTSNGTHNFKRSNKIYTQADLDVYVNENEALKGGLNKTRNFTEKLKKDNARLNHMVKKLSDDNKRLTDEINSLRNAKTPTTSVIGFEIGKDKILLTNRPILLTIAKNLAEDENASVVLVGYADAGTGSAKRNLELSEARAEAVKKILVDLGVNANRVSIVAKGDTHQLFNENDANRVVVSIVNK